MATNQTELTGSQSLEHRPEGGVLAVIERAALNPEIDVEKMRALFELQERVMARQAEMEFNAGFAEMQSEMPEITEMGEIKVDGKIRSTYARFEDINEVCKPILKSYGFALIFKTGVTEKDITVTGILMHKAGHREETALTLPADTSGSKNSVQSIGSSVQYGKRYVMAALLNITTRGEDDDGYRGGTRTVSESQAKILRDLFDRLSEATRAKALEYLSNTYKQEIKAVEDIPSGRYKHAETTLARALNGEGKDKSQSTPALINEIQVVTLQGAIEGIGKTCKSDFLVAFKIKRIGDLPVGKYPDALKWLDEQRRK